MVLTLTLPIVGLSCVRLRYCRGARTSLKSAFDLRRLRWLLQSVSTRDVSDNGQRRDHQHIAAAQIGQMLISAFANRLQAAAEEPSTAR